MYEDMLEAQAKVGEEWMEAKNFRSTTKNKPMLFCSVKNCARPARQWGRTPDNGVVCIGHGGSGDYAEASPSDC